MNIFIDTEDMEERFLEEQYKEYLERENKRLNNIKNKIKQYIKENIISFNEVDMGDIKVILDMLEDE